jgi:hypothetical protein
MTTKFKLVETEKYVLAISDEKIKVGDITPYVIKWTNRYEFFNSNNGIRKSKVSMAKKVIAYKPKGNAPELDLPLLPDVEDEVKKLAKNLANKKGDRMAISFKV